MHDRAQQCITDFGKSSARIFVLFATMGDTGPILRTSDAWLGMQGHLDRFRALREAVIEPAELAAAGQQPSSPISPSTQIAVPAKER